MHSLAILVLTATLVRSGEPRPHVRLRGHSGPVSALEFSADGKWLATYSSKSEEIKVWSTATGRVRATQRTKPGFMSLRLSPDGARLAVWDESTHGIKGQEQGPTPILLYRVGRRKPPVTITAPAIFVHFYTYVTAEFSPDGRTVACWGAGCTRDSRLLLYDADTGKRKAVVGDEHAEVSSVAFSADGKALAWVGWTRNVRTGKVTSRDLTRGTENTLLRLDDDSLHGLRYSLDGTTLAATARDGRRLLLLDAATGKRHATLSLAGESGQSEPDEIGAATFSPDNRIVATGHGSGRIAVWETVTGRRRLTLRGHQAGVIVLTFPAGGKALVSVARSSTEAGEVILWDVLTGTRRVTLRSPVYSLLAVAPAGNVIARAERDGSVSLWHVEKLVGRR
jgi:WD40 repeat protein